MSSGGDRDCPFCPALCAGEAGLAAHVASMHRSDLARLLVVWEDPPRNGRPPTVSAEVRAKIPQLRHRPGTWARLRHWPDSTEGAPRIAVELRRDPRYVGFQFRGSRCRSAHTSTLYGRYVGAAR